MGKLVNRAKMTVSGTPGTGAITLLAAASGYQTLAAAGVVNTDVISYAIEDGTSWEIGQGTYSSTGPTLTRTTVLASSNAGAAISATSAAQVFVTALANDVSPSGWFALTDGATVSWNMLTSGCNASITLGGNRTLATPTNAQAGQTYTLLVVQDATGSRTLTWPASTIIDWGGAGTPALSTTANKIDIVTLVCINSSTPLFRAVISKGT